MQVALLAEPKIPLESSVFITLRGDSFFVHTMNCCATRYPLHMRVYVYRTREFTSAVYGRNAENEPVSRIKMAEYCAVVSMGTL